MPIGPGTRLGQYVVKERIGQGAMGTVFLAEHEALDRTAAVKVMQALGDDAVAVGRFRREGRAIALLRHPNVDGAADCSNPTSGTKVFSTAGYADPLLTEPLPLPTSIPPGDYQLRACNHRTGEQPSGCVQVPFTVTAAVPPVASESRLASPSPSPT